MAEARTARPTRLGLNREVRAAGGIPLRTRPDGDIEVLLVHRPRYDDWTFPKGKVLDGEAVEDAAQREVEEETGLACTLGRELAVTQYTDAKLRKKTVQYWAMENCVGEFEPNDEVDEIAWLLPAEAARLLTYQRDLEVLRSIG
jgi:8-oxo-dGTP diphosphatase